MSSSSSRFQSSGSLPSLHESFVFIGTLADVGKNQSLHQECGDVGLSVSPALDLFCFPFCSEPSLEDFVG